MQTLVVYTTGNVLEFDVDYDAQHLASLMQESIEEGMITFSTMKKTTVIINAINVVALEIYPQTEDAT